MTPPPATAAKAPAAASQHAQPKSDIEIAQAAKKRPILDVAREKLGIGPENLEPYGHYKAKVSMDFIKSIQGRPNGKLILVTAINPTPAGEGKTTTTVGLTDALNFIGKKAMLCIREPSLGPSFGLKGGAAGGGYAQVVPMEDINLHFTGDFHAITSANNLLAALIDNHIYWGNALGIDPRRVAWRRVLDMNDRALRSIVSSLGGVANGFPREDGFDITVASEVMAIFCLARDLDDLKKRLGEYRRRLYPRAQAGARRRPQGPGRHDRAAQGGARAQSGADARGHARLHPWRPVRQYRPWLQLGAGDDDRAQARRLRGDRGRLRRRSRRREIPRHQMPQDRAISRIARCSSPPSVRSRCMAASKKEDLKHENLKALDAGMANLARHVENLQKFGIVPVVSINRFSADTDAEIKLVEESCRKLGVEAVMADHWAEGGKGAAEVARAVVKAAESGRSKLKLLYPDDMPLYEKIRTIAREIYRAKDISADKSVRDQLGAFEAMGYGKFPICIAKTQYSFSTNPDAKGAPTDHVINGARGAAFGRRRIRGRDLRGDHDHAGPAQGAGGGCDRCQGWQDRRTVLTTVPSLYFCGRRTNDEV